MSKADALIRSYIRRAIASAVICVLIFVLASSSFIVVNEADHECTGDGCPVCVLIQQCENTIKVFGTAVLAVFVSIFLNAALTLLTSETADCIVRHTPVSLKTRINS